ncbi:hypothetical protein ES288_A03G165000v1 [Gossypium darwinii]|uniref:Secreted protein n=1 Tax=Gossypium darwinii TaxID=34276 RepID=A0A5D2H4Q7_GOSDA|nr:hypothetical protein ES288_A03G165000v1 [Gossypium darwinii]
MALFLFLLFVSGPFCGYQMRDLPLKTSDSEKIGQTRGYPRLTSLSIKTPSQNTYLYLYTYPSRRPARAISPVPMPVFLKVRNYYFDL